MNPEENPATELPNSVAGMPPTVRPGAELSTSARSRCSDGPVTDWLANGLAIMG